MSEKQTQQPEIDYTEIDPVTGNIFITPIADSKEINIQNELERILSHIRNIKIHLGNPEKYKTDMENANAMLFNFNVGLLCGIKISKKK